MVKVGIIIALYIVLIAIFIKVLVRMLVVKFDLKLIIDLFSRFPELVKQEDLLLSYYIAYVNTMKEYNLLFDTELVLTDSDDRDGGAE